MRANSASAPATDSAVDLIALFDQPPEGWVKIRRGQGVEFIPSSGLSPLLRLACSGRRLADWQVAAGWRLMQDFAVTQASTSNAAAVIAMLERTPAMSAADRAHSREQARVGSLGGMKRARPVRSYNDLTHLRLDAGHRIALLPKRMSRVDWWFCSALCIEEVPLDRMAAVLVEDMSYIRARCREALSSLSMAYAALDAEVRHCGPATGSRPEAQGRASASERSTPTSAPRKPAGALR